MAVLLLLFPLWAVHSGESKWMVVSLKVQKMAVRLFFRLGQALMVHLVVVVVVVALDFLYCPCCPSY